MCLSTHSKKRLFCAFSVFSGQKRFSSLAGVYTDNSALVDHHDLLQRPGALFVIPALYANLFLTPLRPSIFISLVLVPWFPTTLQQLTGGISRADNFPPAAEAVCDGRVDKYRHHQQTSHEEVRKPSPAPTILLSSF